MSKQKVSVASLGSPDHDGWMTKQGGRHKSWKKRWFVLKGNCLYYFKSKKDAELTGSIEITGKSHLKKEPTKKKYAFSVGTPARVYFMYPETQQEQDTWMTKLQSLVDKLAGPKNDSAPKSSQPQPKPTPTPIDKDNKPTVFGTTPIRKKLESGKGSISFLQDEESKVLEFWQIWSESIPTHEEIDEGSSVLFEVSTNASMEKLQWRTSGAQHIFIQRMVDFFWNVGAPETEIDRLNDVGAIVNPIKIGSWIDMSISGGMDGGWFFPVQVNLNHALKAADAGDPITKLENWTKSNEIFLCDWIGRDMGAAPPRQTEAQFKITGSSSEELLRKVVSAFEEFGFPSIPESLLNAIRGKDKFSLSVITSSEGFVRLGIKVPYPTADLVEKLQAAISQVTNVNSKVSELNKFQQSIGVSGPETAEIQYLMPGYGYGVYQEGFDVVFHYTVGEEGPQ